MFYKNKNYSQRNSLQYMILFTIIPCKIGQQHLSHVLKEAPGDILLFLYPQFCKEVT